MIQNRNFILAVGEETPQTIVGNFIRCLGSSGQQLQIQIEGGSNFTIEAGLAFEVKKFEKMRIKNIGTATADCKFVFSDEGFVQDNRLVGNLDLNGSISVLSTLPRYSRYEELAVANGGGELLPFNPARRGAIIKFDAFDYATTLSNGYVISADEDITFEWNTQQELTNTTSGSGGRTFEIWETYD